MIFSYDKKESLPVMRYKPHKDIPLLIVIQEGEVETLKQYT